MAGNMAILNLLKTKPDTELQAIAEKLEQQPILQVLPLGIVDTKPIVENLNNKTQLTVNALQEVTVQLKQLCESVTSVYNRPDLNVEIMARLDAISALIVTLGGNAELEKEMLLMVKAELQK